jgi:hypothetical protein
MGVKNTVMSSMIPKGGIGNLSAIQSALADSNTAAKKTDKKKKK